MNIDETVKMIELLLQNVNNDESLAALMELVIQKRLDLARPKKRSYTKQSLPI